jgi:hypothetical protein
MNSLQRFEVWVSLLVILICFVFLWESWDLPPGTFEPLGSGPVPKATACIIIFCCLCVIWNSFKRKSETGDDGGDPGVISFSAGLTIFVSTILYTSLLHFRAMPFSLMTILFLVFTIWGLERFKRKKFLPALLTGLIIGFATEYLFTEVFIVDLPTWSE